MAQSGEGSPPAKRARLTFGETIEVLVGAGKRSFTVHKDVICSRSSFLKAACEQWMKERKPVELLDDEPHVFDLWLQCVYLQKPPAVENHAVTFELLYGTYILSDKLGDLRSANLVIDEIVRLNDKAKKLPSIEADALAWSGTPANSRLRVLLVDYFVLELNASTFESCISMMPVDMVVAIAKKFRFLKENNEHRKGKEVYWKRVSSQPKCHYHQHDDSHPSCAKSE
ncbi:hypothetical protein LTR08_004551 [Meristemomyces frigidus]|nr:hypothetical protein LTR08_004551 [Meristemomyces frigidus]